MSTAGTDRQRENLRSSQVPIGFEVFRLKGNAVERVRDRLTALLGHLNEYDSEDFYERQVEITKAFHLMGWQGIVWDNQDLIKSVVGDELLVQKEPYLRIARPNNPLDNIGLHKDTFYGASQDEWVLWVPFTDATNGAELRFLPFSVGKDYQTTQESNQDAPQGSIKHWLGFRYAPKKLAPEIEAQCIPVACPFGHAILFNCDVIHGQTVNRAPWTRFSTDIRLVDNRGNFTRNRGLHGEIYSALER